MVPTAPRYDIYKFDGTNDFGLWRINMEALLYSQGLEGPLEQEDKSIGTSIEKEVPILTAE